VFLHLGIKHNKIEETAVKSTKKELNHRIEKIDVEPIIIFHFQFCTERISELTSLIEHLKVHLQPLNYKDVAICCAVQECYKRFDYSLISRNQKIQKNTQLRHLEEHIRAKHTMYSLW
jgi:hypothetical protein